MLHRQAVSKAISRWRLPCLQWGFSTFKQSVASRREDEQKEIREKGWRLAHEAVQRELDTSIASNRSVSQHHEDRLNRERSRRFAICRASIRKMLRANLAKGFELFRARVIRERQLRRTCARVVSRLQRRVLARAFDTFLCQVEREQMLRADEERQDRQNELLKDVLAGTAIGQVLRAKTLQDFALSEVLQEKKV